MLSTSAALVGYAMFALTLLHAWSDGRANRFQRGLLLLTLFAYGTLLESYGVSSGHYTYPDDPFLNLGAVPLSVSLAWVGIIYDVMVIAGRMGLPPWLRILTTTLLALSLDWGMDPIATARGFWVWHIPGTYLGVPGFNMVGWFFIPICYLVAYGLALDGGRVRLLSIRQVDADRSWWRRGYTLFAVVPLSVGGLIIVLRLIGHLPFMRHFSPAVMVAWAILTVTGALGLVVWKRDSLRRTRWFDVLPSAGLALIAAAYVCFALGSGRPRLAGLMFVTAAPLWAVFVFTLRRRDSTWAGVQ